MQVTLDTIIESSARFTVEGFEATRIAVVKGATGHRAALRAPGMPKFGDLHPEDPNSALVEMEAEPVQSDATVRVRLIYRPRPVSTPVSSEVSRIVEPEFITSIRVSSYTDSLESIRDVNGNLMIVEYAGFPDLLSALTGTFLIASDLVTAEYQLPRLSVTIDVNLDELDKNLIVDMIGGINNAPWSGFPARTWLLADINASFENGLWRASYVFQYRPEGWDLEYALEYRGASPQDARVGNGIETFEIYHAVNFNRLRVSW